jgi:hypothetical protein
MKFCIGIVFHNELPWLQLHLPVILEAAGIDGIVAVDMFSTDGSADYMRSLGAHVVMAEDEAWHHNCLREWFLVEQCRNAGYDAMLKTDPDELWFPAHVEQMITMLASGKHQVLQFPTYNFVRDRNHYCPTGNFYPDWHNRAFRLDTGLSWQKKKVHATLQINGLGFPQDHLLETQVRDIMRLPHIHLFHYGWIRSMPEKALRYENQRRRIRGVPDLDRWPADIQADYPYHIPFVGEQPISPDLVGARAPLQDGIHDLGVAWHPDSDLLYEEVV